MVCPIDGGARGPRGATVPWVLRPIPAACFLGLVVSACSRPATPAPEGPIGLSVTSEANLVPITALAPIEAALDTLELFWVQDYEYHRGEHIITELGNSRVFSVRDRDVRVSVLARQGRGPGEVTRPTSLELHGDTIVIFDHGNARVNLHSPDGEFHSSSALRSSARFFALLGDDGSILSVDPSGESALLAMTEPGAPPSPIGGRRRTPYSPLAPYGPDDNGRANHTYDQIATKGRFGYVAHSHDGLIVEVNLDNGETREFTLPEDVLAQLADQITTTNAAFPVPPAFTPVYKSLEVLADGQLLAATAGTSWLGFLIDLENRQLTPISAGKGSDVPSSAVALADGPSPGSVALLNSVGVRFVEIVR